MCRPLTTVDSSVGSRTDSNAGRRDGESLVPTGRAERPGDLKGRHPDEHTHVGTPHPSRSTESWDEGDRYTRLSRFRPGLGQEGDRRRSPVGGTTRGGTRTSGPLRDFPVQGTVVGRVVYRDRPSRICADG